MSEFLQGNGHPLVKPNTPLQVEVNVPKMRPCKLRATFFTQENLPPLKHRPSYGLVSSDGIKADPAKISAVYDMPIPENKKDHQSSYVWSIT